MHPSPTVAQMSCCWSAIWSTPRCVVLLCCRAVVAQLVSRLNADVSWVRALDGSEFMPGLVGLNNMKANDYANAVVQVLARVNPIRDFFLMPANYAGCRSLLVARFGELLRKLWNRQAFKGQVSPHEFMQAVMAASKRRFTIDQQSDPVEFWSWLLNALHMDLTGGKPRKRSIITDTFQGELEVTTLAGTGKGKAATATEDVVERLPFLLMGLELPATPLFKDALEKNIIPQVRLMAGGGEGCGGCSADTVQSLASTLSRVRRCVCIKHTVLRCYDSICCVCRHLPVPVSSQTSGAINQAATSGQNCSVVACPTLFHLQQLRSKGIHALAAAAGAHFCVPV
eukprot:GHRQ01017507.1.p1 GENE.GHRQ01017507.1~~GHRQ01017507.1.p1  ORF type:complete len:341 (+),score=125.54 GHRQ01017507.1:377-1399(+)